ncbi:hypothetical protein CYFUS_009784 [Cystobacter fuscus]|uniref:ApeA N-terminal domain-containing protein n=1 Tax=Cystobacter fuscus TaxID=43 RepID=A0A250JLE4_9BACT|nr:hypothetical protein [Cystobacter fuscus]ATB44297.1 hypothetical protein CYFUS_009784 [Cystobacter fuscus]
MTEEEMENHFKHRFAGTELFLEKQVEEGGVRGWAIRSKDDETWIHFQLRFEWEFVVATDFDKYRPISGYVAMWSRELGVIEAEIALPTQLPGDHPFTHVLHRLGRPPLGEDIQSLEITFPSESNAPRVSLRFASDALRVWRKTGVNVMDTETTSLFGRALIPCLRIEGLSLASEGEANAQLEAFGNGALLELERQTDSAARLQAYRPFRFRLDFGLPSTALGPVTLTPDAAPLNLYMHARLETNNLAARFLGFYQTLEYFFTRYGKGNEKVLFKKTLEDLVTAEELRAFIGQNKELRAFYAKPEMPIVGEHIHITHTERDLLQDTMDRLYQLRCRIVHTKERAESEVFVPFAAEVFELGPDVELIQFLARRALVEHQRPVGAGGKNR